jgi:hypothetical protein
VERRGHRVAVDHIVAGERQVRVERALCGERAGLGQVGQVVDVRAVGDLVDAQRSPGVVHGVDLILAEADLLMNVLPHVLAAHLRVRGGRCGKRHGRATDQRQGRGHHQ